MSNKNRIVVNVTFVEDSGSDSDEDNVSEGEEEPLNWLHTLNDRIPSSYNKEYYYLPFLF